MPDANTHRPGHSQCQTTVNVKLKVWAICPRNSEMTPERCTCGTILVENARFCHRCGRPVFEPENIVTESAVESAAPESAPAPLPIGFGNPVALRVALLMALAVLLVQMIPGVNLLFPLWWLGAGWCAVLLFQRFTGMVLSVRAGARLGSLTGVLAFLSMAVIFALMMLTMGKEVLAQAVKQDARISQILNDPPALAGAMLMVLVVLFGMVVGTCAAGGALGARYAARRGTHA